MNPIAIALNTRIIQSFFRDKETTPIEFRPTSQNPIGYPQDSISLYSDKDLEFFIAETVVDFDCLRSFDENHPGFLKELAMTLRQGVLGPKSHLACIYEELKDCCLCSFRLEGWFFELGSKDFVSGMKDFFQLAREAQSIPINKSAKKLFLGGALAAKKMVCDPTSRTLAINLTEFDMHQTGEKNWSKDDDGNIVVNIDSNHIFSEKELIENVRLIQRALDDDSIDEVVVHCLEGINRSSTMVYAYLALVENRPLVEAIDIIEASRPFVSIFAENLQKIEALRDHWIEAPEAKNLMAEILFQPSIGF